MNAGKCIVFYDIRDPKRLRRVAKILEDYGLRVQKSFFEAWLDEDEIARMRDRLLRAIDPQQDGVKIVRLCGKCAPRRMAAGDAAEMEEPTERKIM